MKTRFLCIITFLAMLLTGAPVHAGAAPVSTAPKYLQYQAGGHVLGFGPGQVYLAGLDHALRVEFAEGNNVAPSGAAAAAQTGRPLPLERVSYTNAWDGVDLTYTASSQGLAESTYTVHPGGRVSSIHLRYNVPVALQPDGSLRYAFQSGYISESAPVAWQSIGGKQVAVQVSFVKQGKNKVGFAAGAYNPAFPLTIDPNYVWHTFYGSSITGDQEANGIAVDGSGNIYVAGLGNESWGSPVNPFAGGVDIAVAKLSGAGVLQWNTFLGSITGIDIGYGIAVDGSGNVYVTGYSTAAWDYGTGTFKRTPVNDYAGGYDIVVAKLDTTGAYQWHTFLGSTVDDVANGIAVDGSGNVYVAGYSNATWSYGTGQFQVLPKNNFAGGSSNIVVAKLDTSGTYLWHTFYGPSTGADVANGVAVDGSGNVYVAGYSSASWSVLLPGALFPTPALNLYAGGDDIVALKLDTDGAYQWHTFYGSATGDDYAYAVAVDKNGNVYLSGTSNATWNGPLNETARNAYVSGIYMVVVKLNTNGGYLWHTFHGSSCGNSFSYALTTDSIGEVYVAGYSECTWNGPSGQAPLNGFIDGEDMVELKLDTNGWYMWHTFYGSDDTPHGVALDSSANLYVAGWTGGNWIGPASQPPLHASNGGLDIFILKMYDPFLIFLPFIQR